MSDEYTQPIGYVGGISNMVPQTFISRRAEESAGVDFGEPVQKGTGDKDCKQGATKTTFTGIAVRESGKDKFDQNDEVRIMTQGVVYVKVKSGATVTAGETPIYDDGWTNTGNGKAKLSNAVYDTGGGAGELVELRIWGPGVESS